MASALITELHKKSNSLENLFVSNSVGAHARPQSIACDPSVSRPHLITSEEFGGSNESGVNLVGYRQISSNNLGNSNARWHSDTNLASNPYHSHSQLSVNKDQIDINDEKDSITIYWDIKANVSAKDWIGLYRTDQAHPGKWLDYRNRGVSGSKKGELVWHFSRLASIFTELETRVCFRYYYGNTGDLRAVTEPILVKNSSATVKTLGTIGRRLSSVDGEAEIVHLAIQDIEATHVRKGMFFNPDPYVKIRVEPGPDWSEEVLVHHYKDSRTSVCENTTEPRWPAEIFHFMALPSDNLFMKVKDRFTSARPTLLRFLGQISVPIKHVIERARLGLTVTSHLMGRTPHDHVCGTIVFRPTIIPHDTGRTMLNGENGRVCCDVTENSVENILDRSSASILSSTDEEDENSPSSDGPTTSVRELTHTYSGTSGDSSIDAGMSLGSTIEPEISSSSTVQVVIEDSPVFSSDDSQEERSMADDALDPPRCDSDVLLSAMDMSIDPLTAYQQEACAASTAFGVGAVSQLAHNLPQSIKETLEAEGAMEPDQILGAEGKGDVEDGKSDSGGYNASSDGVASGVGAVSSEDAVSNEDNSIGGETHSAVEQASGEGVIGNAAVSGGEEASDEGVAGNAAGCGGENVVSTSAADLEFHEGNETTEPHEQNTLELSATHVNEEKRRSLPPPDYPPPRLVGDTQLPVDNVNSSSPTSKAATAVLSVPSIAECALLKVGGDKSSSVWSLENHTGSRENICEVEPPGGLASAHQTSQPLSDGLSVYQNMSSLVQRSNPPTPEPDGGAKEKRPLPLPRDKTLTEQLNNLQVIESEASTYHRQSLPPSLPHKTKVMPGRSKRKTLESEDSLEMPAGLAPLPPNGAKPKRVLPHRHEVAAQYAALDVMDARPKRVAEKDEPPVLQPRKKVLAEVPPRLPPRSRQKADGSVVNTGQQEVLLDEVFEPAHAHRHHPKHHRPKGRKTESEEARVAAEVANAAASLPRSHNMKSESIEVEEALPAGWEARVDSHGRVFYIDHNNKSTTWERPSGSIVRGQAASHRGLQRVPSISNSDRMNMDNRYRIIKRMSSVDTISERNLSPPRHHAPAPPSQPASVSQANLEPHSISPSTTPRPQSTLPQATVAAASTSSSHQAAAPASAQGAASTSTAAGPAKPAAAPPDAETRQLQEVIRNSPAVKFLKRTDFFSLVQYSDEAQVAYTSNSALKHMVHKIRKDPMTFHKYWHNKDLVNFLNMFVNKEEELPGNWQMKHDKTGKVFFLDHSTKTTTFIDPRLPTVQPALDPGHQMPLPRNKYRPGDGTVESVEGVSNLPTAYDEKVVIFLRQPNVMQVLQDKYPLLKKNDSLKNKINTIISDGTPALNKYRNHIELTILLSMFENEVMSYVPLHLRAHQESHHTSPKGSPAPTKRLPAAPLYKRDFQEKYRTFLRKLEGKGIGQGPNKIKMRVQRNHLLEDSFKKIMSYGKKDLQKNKLLISFLGEEGLDYGGPAREFFFLLSRELFNPYYGLFEYSANDTYTVQISPMSTFVDNAAEWFRFAGRMIGLCIVHQYLMDSFFTRPFYKMLLRETCVLSDLESLDAEFHQSLLWIKDNDISEAGLDLTFSVDEEIFGQVTERELKPNGMNIPVTNRNKKEYIEKMVTWRIDRGVNEQKEHLMKGFYEVIEPKLISVFDAKDLELVIAGTAEIDIIDWRNNTEYRSGYYDTHPIVDWFWQVMQSFDNEKRLRLLQFVTGTSSIPFEGFSALRGSNGPRKFTIEKWGTAESLPRAHTCFNRLDLPMYTSKETMQEKLLLAISETSTFGIE